MVGRDTILELLEDDDVAVFFEPDVFDSAILGLTTSSPGWDMKPRVCYSRARILTALMEFLECDYEEALDYYGFNIAGFGLSDPPPPLIIHDGFDPYHQPEGATHEPPPHR